MEGLFKTFGLSNIHPIIVHFPIAFALLYGTLELIPSKKLHEKLFTTKAILASLSFFSIFAAKQAGEVARLAYSDNQIQTMINTHEKFANFSFYIFFAIFVLYSIQILSKAKPNLLSNNYFKFALQISSTGIILATLAVLGLAFVSLTGALGGLIVWGPDNDPFSRTVYDLFFGS